MKNKKIIYKNFIQEKYLNFNLNKKLNKIYSRIFENIFKNLDTSLDTFHILSNKFKLNFEKIKQSLLDKPFDCILIPGVLHETENPDYFLDRIA